jgi:acetyl esterase
LKQIEALGAPRLETLPVEDARAACVADIQTLGEPEPVREIRDRTVPGPDGEIPVRIYAPQGASQDPLPVLVYYHGGGWVVCNIATHDHLCRSIANAAGSLVVSVEYRLAPEHKCPAAVEDAYAAARWVAKQGESIGADPSRLAVGGDSAGGNLAAAVSLMARDRGEFLPCLQLLIYPITDYNLDTPSYRENADGYVLTRSQMRWFWDCYLAREEDGYGPYVSPLRADDLSGLPPALVITAEYDPLRDEGEAYAARLREAGVPVTHTRYKGMIHPFLRRTAIFDQAKAALKQVTDSLKQAFRGNSGDA